MTGAAQWRVRCPHISDDSRKETAMGSQVSSNNVHHVLKEGRVAPAVDREQLERWLAEVQGRDDASALVVCNECRRVLIPGDPPEVLHEGKPRNARTCGCLGCTEEAQTVVEHPEHGERVVCGLHAVGLEVVRDV